MARPKNPNLERTWQDRLWRQARSRLSIAEFCAREGVSSSSFHAWKRRLAARSLSTRPESQLFVPIHLDSPRADGERAAWRGVELELPHQVRLHFDSPPEPEWLGRVVAVLATLPNHEAMP